MKQGWETICAQTLRIGDLLDPEDQRLELVHSASPKYFSPKKLPKREKKSRGVEGGCTLGNRALRCLKEKLLPLKKTQRGRKKGSTKLEEKAQGKRKRGTSDSGVRETQESKAFTILVL